MTTSCLPCPCSPARAPTPCPAAEGSVLPRCAEGGRAAAQAPTACPQPGPPCNVGMHAHRARLAARLASGCQCPKNVPRSPTAARARPSSATLPRWGRAAACMRACAAGHLLLAWLAPPTALGSSHLTCDCLPTIAVNRAGQVWHLHARQGRQGVHLHGAREGQLRHLQVGPAARGLRVCLECECGGAACAAGWVGAGTREGQVLRWKAHHLAPSGVAMLCSIASTSGAGRPACVMRASLPAHPPAHPLPPSPGPVTANPASSMGRQVVSTKSSAGSIGFGTGKRLADHASDVPGPGERWLRRQGERHGAACRGNGGVGCEGWRRQRLMYCLPGFPCCRCLLRVTTALRSWGQRSGSNAAAGRRRL